MFQVKCVVKHNEQNLINQLRAKVQMTNRLLLEDIHRESRYKTPLSRGLSSDGDLREQVSKRVRGMSGEIEWKVPYATYQERGKRWDGSHVVRNYTTPGTGKEFAKNAVKSVVKTKNIKKYLKFGAQYHA